jgi:hypothetical protein
VEKELRNQVGVIDAYPAAALRYGTASRSAAACYVLTI